MKKLILATSLFLIAVSVTAAEINFLENPVWATVLEKAKKENKMIFLDGYATWCGPCKQMDAETYKNQAVADYYNANFINVKYDMEKGEGKTLAEKYFVTAYPSLLFINSDGVILHKGVGFLEGTEFADLGKTAKDPNSQYYTLKKKALELTNAQFEKFAAMAEAFEDEDADMLFDQYLSKQSDILGNDNLINLVMLYVRSLPSEKMLQYFKANKEKVIKSGKFTAEDFDGQLVSLVFGYAGSPEVQINQDEIDFASIKRILEEYIPDRAFMLYQLFEVRYYKDEKKMDKAIASFNVLIENTPEKVSYDVLCNLMMNVLPDFGPDQAEILLKKFDAIPIDAKNADKKYMKDYLRCYLALKNKEIQKFKTLANAMIANPDLPANVKEDLKAALAKMSEN